MSMPGGEDLGNTKPASLYIGRNYDKCVLDSSKIISTDYNMNNQGYTHDTQLIIGCQGNLNASTFDLSKSEIKFGKVYSELIPLEMLSYYYPPPIFEAKDMSNVVVRDTLYMWNKQGLTSCYSGSNVNISYVVPFYKGDDKNYKSGFCQVDEHGKITIQEVHGLDYDQEIQIGSMIVEKRSSVSIRRINNITIGNTSESVYMITARDGSFIYINPQYNTRLGNKMEAYDGSTVKCEGSFSNYIETSPPPNEIGNNKSIVIYSGSGY